LVPNQIVSIKGMIHFVCSFINVKKFEPKWVRSEACAPQQLFRNAFAQVSTKERSFVGIESMSLY
jgi:hypothetical protein